jgi:hypothetical protein
MSGGERLSNRDREDYLIKMKKEFAFAGVSIPDRLTIDGEQIRLRSYVMEISKKKGNLTPEEIAKVDHVAALARKKRNSIVKKIGSGDLTKDEAESLFRTATGLGRALDTLDRVREPKMTVTEASRKAKVEDGRRWMSMVKQIYGRERKRDGFH